MRRRRSCSSRAPCRPWFRLPAAVAPRRVEMAGKPAFAARRPRTPSWRSLLAAGRAATLQPYFLLVRAVTLGQREHVQTGARVIGAAGISAGGEDRDVLLPVLSLVRDRHRLGGFHQVRGPEFRASPRVEGTEVRIERGGNEDQSAGGSDG